MKGKVMKTPEWEKGRKGAISEHPSKNGKLPKPDGKVIPDMIVSAKCKGESIRLRILHETEPEVFKASIMGDYFLDTPEELNNGDEVTIDREHILWLHGEG
jgi:hypothetical protein